jgi:hypothetical protein
MRYALRKAPKSPEPWLPDRPGQDSTRATESTRASDAKQTWGVSIADVIAGGVEEEEGSWAPEIRLQNVC